MTSLASRGLRTLCALALTVAAAAPCFAFNPQPDPPGFDPQPDPPGVCLPCSVRPPAPHNPPGY